MDLLDYAAEPAGGWPAAAPPVPPSPRPPGGVTLEEATRARAYHLWELAGRPGGDGTAFWLAAESQLASPPHHLRPVWC